jgi:hypothetical protein
MSPQSLTSVAADAAAVQARRNDFVSFTTTVAFAQQRWQVHDAVLERRCARPHHELALSRGTAGRACDPREAQNQKVGAHIYNAPRSARPTKAEQLCVSGILDSAYAGMSENCGLRQWGRA